jgi:SAM-dependent methyltransferase
VTTIRDARRPVLLLYLSAAALTAELVHLIVYGIGSGIAPTFAEAMAFGGHHSYFMAVFAATAIALGGAILLSPLDLQAIRNHVPARRFALAWVAMMVVGSLGFLLLENLETLHGDHPLAGLSPTHWLIDPGVLAATALVCAAVAAIVTVLTTQHPGAYASVLTSSYADLVATGVYDAAFQHADWATAFFAGTLDAPLVALGARRPLRVLEAGVGTGFWLGRLPQLVADPSAVELRGFDLSAEMVGAARLRLAEAGIAADLAVGDILEADAYSFPSAVRHDVVFAYDVVQQLPRELQDAAVAQLYGHVAEGGWLVVFDHDADSRYGRTMGLKKWLRRHVGVPLVPYHYIHSRYPSMVHLHRLLQAAGATGISVAVEAQGRHRAISATRPADLP